MKLIQEIWIFRNVNYQLLKYEKVVFCLAEWNRDVSNYLRIPFLYCTPKVAHSQTCMVQIGKLCNFKINYKYSDMAKCEVREVAKLSISFSHKVYCIQALLILFFKYIFYVRDCIVLYHQSSYWSILSKHSIVI